MTGFRRSLSRGTSGLPCPITNTNMFWREKHPTRRNSYAIVQRPSFALLPPAQSTRPARPPDRRVESERRYEHNFPGIHNNNTGNMSAIDKIDYQTYFGSEGSWTPTVLIASVLLVRYLHSNSVSFQRFVSQQRIHWRRRLGYRDNTKYQMGVGDGANMSLKRQG